ncbi:putative Zinc finger protein [Fasciola hepatica]|uniref:RING-type E3 ubiquitin transferase n=1 Tax=Fasciola hepatica TaxID=6192 RepID=A0A4E0RJL9_FASHE|nr:putative Zinc finger protein [Fasciola hepatica]
MATSSMPPNYYCHVCETEVEPNLQDFTCSLCHSGFIEEVTLENTASRAQELLFTEEPDEDEIMAEEDIVPPRSRRHSGARRRGDGSRSGRETFTLRIPSPQSLVSTRVRVATPDNPFLLHVLSGVDALQHDIRNYAWNTDMLDNLITFLMNQLQVGPPPATDAAIAALPVLDMTEELISRHKACSICFEDFQVSERCTRLPCQHVYHTTCVNTWLKQHATCPVCRKDLAGRDTSRMDATNSGPSVL